jgi:ankyrin repeat protein
MKALFNLLLIAITFTACTQSDSNTKSTPGTNAPGVDIHTAVMTNNIEAVKQHIEAGTDLNQKEPMSGSTPLINAVTFDKKEIAEALIEAGADLEVKNNDGSTALHSASFFCRVELVQMLINANADKEVRNNFGATPRETVMGPFEAVKPIYEMMQQQLSPFGLQLDLQEIEKTRPVIAMMLQ